MIVLILLLAAIGVLTGHVWLTLGLGLVALILVVLGFLVAADRGHVRMRVTDDGRTQSVEVKGVRSDGDLNIDVRQ